MSDAEARAQLMAFFHGVLVWYFCNGCPRHVKVWAASEFEQLS